MTKERETHLNLISENRSHWIVFTDDPVMIRLFDSKGYEQIKSVGLGFQYKIPANLLQFKPLNKITRKLSEEEKQRRRLRLIEVRAKKTNKLLEK